MLGLDCFNQNLAYSPVREEETFSEDYRAYTKNSMNKDSWKATEMGP